VGLRRFELEVPPPFRLDLTVWALRRRPDNALGRFDGTCYRRTLLASGQILEIPGSREHEYYPPRRHPPVRPAGAGTPISARCARALRHWWSIKLMLDRFHLTGQGASGEARKTRT
jgi:DNA-3-methyladenine glycosylase II